MRKLRKIGLAAGLLLFILAAAWLYVAGKNLARDRPADQYQDKGVHRFLPQKVLPTQVENTATGRHGRLYPTKTVYFVFYRAEDGSNYQWKREASTQQGGQKIIEEGQAVERRVLSIPDEKILLVEPDQTAESYTGGLRWKYEWMVGLSAVYIGVYLASWIILFAAQTQAEKNSRTRQLDSDLKK